jgi:predicted ester cyclase
VIWRGSQETDPAESIGIGDDEDAKGEHPVNGAKQPCQRLSRPASEARSVSQGSPRLTRSPGLQGGLMPTTLSTDEMKAKVRSHFEDFNNRKAEVIRTNMTSDFYDHDGPGEEPTDTSGDEEMMRQMYRRMPDLHLAIEDLIAEDDKVVCKNHWRWTDAQTGKKMGFHGFVLWRSEGDRIAERWATVTTPAEDSSWG